MDVIGGVFPSNPELDEAFKLVDTNKPAISELSDASTKPSITSTTNVANGANLASVGKDAKVGLEESK